MTTRRLRALCRRHLRELERGKLHFELANVALCMVRNSGFSHGDRIEIEQFDKEGKAEMVEFELIDNAIKLSLDGKIYRQARVANFELKPVSKTRLKAEAAAANSEQPAPA